MKRNFQTNFAICTIALGLSTALAASPVLMTFDSVNGAQMGGFYVGPYSGTMDGAPVPLYCDDFANEVAFGQQWEANLTPISLTADLADTRYGTAPGALQLYQQAAWLTEQYAVQPVAEYGDIQATIWQLFNSAALAPSSSRWLDLAHANFASADYSGFRIVTNTAPVRLTGQIQEFLTRIPSSPAPEPGTQALAGLALVGASCVARKIRRKPLSPTSSPRS